LALIFVNAAFSGWHVLGKLALNNGEAPPVGIGLRSFV
jgi:hypothetical protein